ncbi:hypothetical protein FB451DRAFT_1172168 [Mycena latifolia]|nr:hypothetical protein FB451DRAFT_1172168 [Mycena latifolia]
MHLLDPLNKVIRSLVFAGKTLTTAYQLNIDSSAPGRRQILASGTCPAVDYILPTAEPSPTKGAARGSARSPTKTTPPRQPNPKIITIDSDDDDDIDAMLLDTIESRVERLPKRSGRAPLPNAQPTQERPNTNGTAADLIFADTDSSTPCPVWFEGCGMQAPEGDDEEAEVQCQECRLWAHIGCLSSDVEWDDPAVEFICKRCRHEPLIDLLTLRPASFNPNQIVLVSSPLVPNWKADGVLWYPARVVERHRLRGGKKDEYEFRWLECNDGTIYDSASSEMPVMLLRTFFKSRRFCQEIDEVTITEEQGQIRMPRYMDPSFEHENSTLATIFDEAVPTVAKILAKFGNSHPVVEHFNVYFKGNKTIDRSQQASVWMRSFGLVPTPELKLFSSAGCTKPERSERVPGVGSALLQLLAVQHELGEPLNLNGDLLRDLLDGRVVHCPHDGNAGLEVMFSAVSGSRRAATVLRCLLKFKCEHATYDEDYRPPTFCCHAPSRFAPTEAIPVGSRRIGDHGDEKVAKRAKKVNIAPKKHYGAKAVNAEGAATSPKHIIALEGQGHTAGTGGGVVSRIKSGVGTARVMEVPTLRVRGWCGDGGATGKMQQCDRIALMLRQFQILLRQSAAVAAAQQHFPPAPIHTNEIHFTDAPTSFGDGGGGMQGSQGQDELTGLSGFR